MVVSHYMITKITEYVSVHQDLIDAMVPTLQGNFCSKKLVSRGNCSLIWWYIFYLNKTWCRRNMVTCSKLLYNTGYYDAGMDAWMRV